MAWTRLEDNWPLQPGGFQVPCWSLPGRLLFGAGSRPPFDRCTSVRTLPRRGQSHREVLMAYLATLEDQELKEKRLGCFFYLITL